MRQYSNKTQNIPPSKLKMSSVKVCRQCKVPRPDTTWQLMDFDYCSTRCRERFYSQCSKCNQSGHTKTLYQATATDLMCAKCIRCYGCNNLGMTEKWEMIVVHDSFRDESGRAVFPPLGGYHCIACAPAALEARSKRDKKRNRKI